MINRIVSRFLLLPVFLSTVVLDGAPRFGKASEPKRASEHLHALQYQVQSVSQRVIPMVVAIETPGRLFGLGGGDTLGTGVIISPDGLVLSQFHVTHGSVASRVPAGASRRKPGERLVVVLHDGRKVEAEILGGVPHLDISMLRIVTSGNWAHAELAEETEPEIGDRVLKLGHPRGYQPGRPPVVRLGRVVGRDGDVVLADCLIEGGDSGGPLFGMDGTVVAIIRNSAGTGELRKISSSVASYTAVSLLREFQERMVSGEIVIPDHGDELVAGPNLSPHMSAAADWTNGAETRSRYRNIVWEARKSVVEVLYAGDAVSLGTVVGEDGWIITKASELPGVPMCRLSDGRELTTQVLGVHPAFDLAALKVEAEELQPIEWSDASDLQAGTLLAAPGLEDLPLAVGVVSVPLRDLPGPYPERVTSPPPVSAAPPEVVGSPVLGRGYWVEYVEGRAAEAAISPGDVILSIGGEPVRDHQDLVRSVQSRFAGDTVDVAVRRGHETVGLQLRLRPARLPVWSRRKDGFPRVLEHDMPLRPVECGGPVVGLDGRAVGINIARVGDYGSMAFPSEDVRRLLPELMSGKLAHHWKDPAAARRREKKPEPSAGEAVSLTVDDLREQLRQRRERINRLYVEYEVTTDLCVDPEKLLAWRLLHARNGRETHRLAFADEKRFVMISGPESLPYPAPLDRIQADPDAPPEIREYVQRNRQAARRRKAEGELSHLFASQQLSEAYYVFDGQTCYRWEHALGKVVEVAPSFFYAPRMYLASMGLQPPDPEGSERQRMYSFPDNLDLFTSCELLPRTEQVEGAECVVLKCESTEERNGQKVEALDQFWFDPELKYALRKWEQTVEEVLRSRRTHTAFEEVHPGLWMPMESRWTIATPVWTGPEYRGQPAFAYVMRVRQIKTDGDVAESLFEPDLGWRPE